jgi:hypothetical protein
MQPDSHLCLPNCPTGAAQYAYPQNECKFYEEVANCLTFDEEIRVIELERFGVSAVYKAAEPAMPKIYYHQGAYLDGKVDG